MSIRTIKTALLTFALCLAPAALHAQDPANPDPLNIPLNNPSSNPSNNPSTNQNRFRQAANRNQPQPGTQDSTNSASPNPQSMKDKQFVRKASEGGFAEIQLGKLALTKSSNDGVKTFAQKMVDDHTMLNSDMKPIADALGVMTPHRLNKMDQAEYEKLNALSGADFDKEYIDFMVKDHRKDLREFREESTSAADPALKDATTKGAKVIREHLSMVEKLASENGVEVPGGRPHPGPTT